MKKATRARRGRGDDRPAGGSAGRAEGAELVLRIVGTVPPGEGGTVQLELAEPARLKGRLIDWDEVRGMATILLENVVLKVPILGGVLGAEESAPVDERPGSEGCVGE